MSSNLIGRTFGRWTVIKVAQSRRGPNGNPRTYWMCRCACGVEREVLAGNLTTAVSRSCGCLRNEVTGDLSRARRREVVGYYSAHRRVDRDRGRAKTHACVDCGGRAEERSYDHRDDQELTDPRGRRYSLDSQHYSPRCRTCHGAFDSARRMAVAS